MRPALLLLTLVAAFDTSSPQATAEVNRKIIGGRDVPIGRYPFVLSLRYYNVHFCGASILNSRHALTAAHCLDKGIPITAISFRASSASRHAGGAIVPLLTFVLHPFYNALDYSFDVAVARVRGVFPLIPTGLLPPVALQLPEGISVTVVGWGYNEIGKLSDTLQYVRLPIVGATRCRTAWPGYIKDSNICAGAPNRDSCGGDSGGPLIYGRRLVVGVVSWGAEDCGNNLPGVYASTSNPLIRAFIVQNALLM